MTTAYDPNANDANDYDDGTYRADDNAPARSSDLAEGTYTARAIQWDWDEDKNGEPCIALMFELSSGKPGYRIDGRLYLDESKPDKHGRTSLSRSMEALFAMGLQGQLPADLSTVDLTVGTVSLVIEINAKGYPQTRFINAPRSARELRIFAVPPAPKVNAMVAKINARVAAMTAGARASGTAPMAAPIVQPAAQQRPVARPQPAAQGRPVVGGQNGQTNARAAQSTQRPAPTPPPRMQGQGMGEFQGADDDIPF